MLSQTNLRRNTHIHSCTNYVDLLPAASLRISQIRTSDLLRFRIRKHRTFHSVGLLGRITGPMQVPYLNRTRKNNAETLAHNEKIRTRIQEQTYLRRHGNITRSFVAFSI
jgi:hypothetical protein